MTTAQFSLFWPAMQITKVDGQHRRTASEPGVATITLPDRTIIMPCVIPPTVVTKQGGLLWRQKWLVDACVGMGQTADGVTLTANLPPEPTVWSWPDLTMVAQPINVPTLLVLAGGAKYSGIILYPRCRISQLLSSIQIAEAITCVGVLSNDPSTFSWDV